jgi:hypothetical protein
MYVSVIGGERCSTKVYEMAREVGRRLAAEGHVVVTGGRGGVMEAVCRGAREEGGVTIGILPSTERSEGNRYLVHAVVTGIGHARNVLVVVNGDVVIAIDGHYGTLSEIALALNYGKPVYGLLSWEVGIENFNTVEALFEKLARDRQKTA